MPDDPIQRILVFAAHPDDCDVGCGASAAKWAAQGKDVFLVVCTQGNKGSSDTAMTEDRLVAMRDAEQRAAADCMGIKDVVILPNEDGGLNDSYEVRGQFVKMIRTFRPDRVVTHNPFIWQHRDHRFTGQNTLDAVYPYARDRLHFPEHLAEGLEPHKVREVYLWTGFNNAKPEFVDIEEDVTDYLEAKIAALSCHVSQFGQPEETRKRWMDRFGDRIKETGKFVELFKRVEYQV
jgi:LmbE family N-acetylglucosaminyl deacetylase